MTFCDFVSRSHICLSVARNQLHFCKLDRLLLTGSLCQYSLAAEHEKPNEIVVQCIQCTFQSIQKETLKSNKFEV